MIIQYYAGMPELPEVQTTVNGLRQTVVGLRITDVWSDYDSPYFEGSGTIKDPLYFKYFKKIAAGQKIVSADRRAKNVLINLSNGLTILVHMKMTGHLLYGKYHFNTVQKAASGQEKSVVANKKESWTPIEPESLKDPFNRHIHFVLTFSNGKHLALSDMRKFAKVTMIETGKLDVVDSNKKSGHYSRSEHLKNIGPEPLEKSFTLKRFTERLNLREHGKIKQVLMDQSIIAGIGNIYADESLWRAGIHPLERVENIPLTKMKLLFTAIKKTLARGIDLGGDSMSDYRNIRGERGRFQEHHRAYRKTGERCERRGCGGTIQRVMIGARSAHFCGKHQKLSKAK